MLVAVKQNEGFGVRFGEGTRRPLVRVAGIQAERMGLAVRFDGATRKSRFCLVAVKQDGGARAYVSEEYAEPRCRAGGNQPVRGDLDIMLEAVEHNGPAVQYASVCYAENRMSRWRQ